jgi:hypothetical protein
VESAAGDRQTKLASIAAYFLARGNLESSTISAAMQYLCDPKRPNPATAHEVSEEAIEEYRQREDFGDLVELHAARLNPQFANAELGRAHSIKERVDLVAAATLLSLAQLAGAIRDTPLAPSGYAQQQAVNRVAALSRALACVSKACGLDRLRADTAFQADASKQAGARLKAAELAAQTSRVRALLGVRTMVEELRPRAAELIEAGEDPEQALWRAAQEKVALTNRGNG